MVRAAVDGADLLEEGGFAGVVEAEEEDRVFCDGEGEWMMGWGEEDWRGG